MMTINMTLVWGVILEVMGRFYANSTGILESWRLLSLDSKNETVFIDRFNKARCRPLAFGLEGYRKIPRLSVLDFVSCIGIDIINGIEVN